MRGFSMLEVLVAFVILALVGTALFRLFSGALTTSAAAEDYSRAVLVADSVLAEAAGDAAAARRLAVGHAPTTAASRGRRRFRRTSRRRSIPTPSAARSCMPTRLWRVVAEVRVRRRQRQDRGHFKLATVRLGARDAQ